MGPCDLKKNTKRLHPWVNEWVSKGQTRAYGSFIPEDNLAGEPQNIILALSRLVLCDLNIVIKRLHTWVNDLVNTGQTWVSNNPKDNQAVEHQNIILALSRLVPCDLKIL